MSRRRWTITPGQQIVAAAVVGAVLLVGSFVHDEWHRYDEELAQAERNLRTAATLLAEHTARTFDAAESALRAAARIREDAETNGYDPATVHELLKAVHDGSPVLRAVGWIDADGNRIASSLFADPPPLNVAGQEQFVAVRDGGYGRDRIHVAAPVRSRLLNDWILVASLRMEKPDGSFDGMAGGVIDPAYFSRVFNGIDFGAHDVVTLFREDGTIMVRTPLDEDLMGVSLAGRHFMTEIVPRRPIGTFQAFGLSDGEKRVIGYAVDPDSGFIVTVAARTSEILTAFWQGVLEGVVRLSIIIAALAVGTWALVRQVRRREQLSAELRLGEARFRDFASSTGDWFWETDDQHRFVWLSDSVRAATGVPAAWHLGRSRIELAAPAGIPSELWEEHHAGLDAHRPFRDFEYIRRGPTGDRWLRVSGVPRFDDEGRFLGYRGSGRDITELRRAEQRLHDAVETLPAGFMLFDVNDRLVYTNGNTATMTPELAAHYRLGDTFEQILRRCVEAGAMPEAAEDPDRWIAWRLQRHLAAEGSTTVRFGDRVVEVVERGTSEGGIMVLRFDITDRERARLAAQEAREAADAANRAKSEFLSSMSHELRTPLNAIIGFGQILKLDRGQSLSADQRQYCDHIVKSGEHLLNLVNEVLDLAGIEAGRLRLSIEPVGVAEVVREAVRTMQPVADKAGVALRAPVQASDLGVRADAQRLRQVLLNLLSNAIKYNRPDGSVTVQVEPAEDDFVRVSVVDTGPGIPADRQAQLFTPFQRLGAEFTHVEGTGIGLALCKRLVAAMQGRIGMSSEVGLGSTFWIDVPAAASASTPPVVHPQAAESPLASAGGYSVLYIEDNPLNVALMEHLLETLPNVPLYAAPSGQIGLDLARAQRPDLIVLDLNLPGMSGFEVLEQLKGHPETADIPVIALTASAMPHDVRRGLACGFFRYLAKPLKFDLFLESVDAALLQRRSAGTRAAKRA